MKKHDERPYVFIIIFCIIIGIVRFFILEGWPLWGHLITLIGQIIFVAAIWNLVQVINSKLESRYSFEQQPIRRIVLQVFFTMLLISPAFILSFLFARPYIPNDLDYRHLLMITMVVFMLLLVMIFSFYAYDFFKKLRVSLKEKSQLEIATARLNEEKSLMQYHHLRNQVNPHFLFNTLTSLDGLIQTDPALASQFVRHLSKVYRYVLEHKENEVVSLETEQAFIRHYISLLSIRYNETIRVDVKISEEARDKGIVMVTLQMLIDNAIKHNQVHAEEPLIISIWDEGNILHVRNNKQLRKQIENSTKHGLRQLKQLYAFLTSQPVVIDEDSNYFDVKLPLL